MRSDDATTTPAIPTRRVVIGAAAALASGALRGGCTPGVVARPDAIKLNTTPNAASPRSLNLRRNAVETIAIPEWTTAGSGEAWEAPVAYNLAAVGSGAVTIEARLRAFEILADGTSAPWTGKAPVRATGGGILGDLGEVPVDFVDGVSTPEYITFSAADHSLGASGVRGVTMEDIVWTWQVRRPGDPDFIDVGSTHHRVYTVYRKPREPWDNTPGSAQNAWTEALDLACSIGGGVGMRDDLDEICCALAGLFNAGGSFCDTVNGTPSTTSGALMYDTASTSRHYSWSTHVELGAFLERCRGGVGHGPLVNCSDCAALFSTLANLLGANLWQGQVLTGLVMPVMPIGCGSWWQPSSGYVSASGVHASELLGFHEIVWKGDVHIRNLVWDVCFLVNGVADPLDPNAGHPSTRIVAYPWGIPFSSTDGVLDYREMLADPGNVVNCVPDVPSKVRRIPI